MVIGDSFEMEVAGNPNGAEFHTQGFIHGKGLGNIAKTVMLLGASGM